MDYEKKYKEEIIRATQLWECGDITRENLEYIFPELKESEDEKVRKAIKYCIMQGFIGHGYIDNVTVDDCLTWLEKQGKQIPADKVESKDYSSIDPHFGKPIDKQKPKFHEGDWVINC